MTANNRHIVHYNVRELYKNLILLMYKRALDVALHCTLLLVAHCRSNFCLYLRVLLRTTGYGKVC
jgi:hypothetical protein